MNVYDAAWESFEQRRLDHPHPSRENNEFDPRRLATSHEPLLGFGFELCPESSRREELRAQSALASERRECPRHDIGNHDPHFGCEFAARDGVGDRTKVRAFAGPRIPRRSGDHETRRFS